jgi:PAS domain S-box-containing protein
MVEDITDKKTAEEARLRHVAIVESSEDAIASGTLDGIIVSWNAGAQHMYGYTEAEAVGKPITMILPPELREEENKILETVNAGGRIEQFETVRVTKTGKRINVSLSVSPIKDSSGRIVGISGIARDITERKLAEEALSDMTRKLVEAQEKERARIARELHDDINQKLAMLSLELEQLQENSSEIQPRVKELRRQIDELSNDVQALSHELHSSKLEYLGVVAGIRSWCKESGERKKIEIEFRSDVSSTLPFDVGLCLFRVLQEAVHNAVKHSGVKRIEIQLREDPSRIHLVIRDLGGGFDIEAASQGKGLGLTSMRERVRLVNGTIAIESKPMGGTTIHVCVPFTSKTSSARAVG